MARVRVEQGPSISVPRGAGSEEWIEAVFYFPGDLPEGASDWSQWFTFRKDALIRSINIRTDVMVGGVDLPTFGIEVSDSPTGDWANDYEMTIHGSGNVFADRYEGGPWVYQDGVVRVQVIQGAGAANAVIQVRALVGTAPPEADAD